MSRSLRQTFRVPKKTNRQIIEILKEGTDQRQFLQSKLIDSFKKPEISKSNMQFIQFWSIKNPDSESRYFKSKHRLKTANQSVVENFGFLYIKTEGELQSLAEKGQIKVGNVGDSKLATGSLGVSLSQFCDIFHPGDDNNCVPNGGILLIVKYVKGKVNYVPYSDNPMEPQPEYNCHIIRNSCSQIESTATAYKAFHSTQVFLYEYSEDVEIGDYPSQLVIIGATKFTWTRKYIFRTTLNKENIVKKTTVKRRLPENVVYSDALSVSHQHINTFVKFNKPNISNDLVPIASGNIRLGASAADGINISVMLMTMLKEPIPIYNLMTSNWNLTEVIPNRYFLEFFNYMDIDNKAKILKISQTKITPLPPRFCEGKGLKEKPKHVMYLNMIPSTLSDKRSFTKLIDNLNKTGTVGRITTRFFPNILFFVFPSGKISDNLGIPKDDGSSLHVIILFFLHPEVGCNAFHGDEYTFVSLIDTYNNNNRHDKGKKYLISQKSLRKAVESSKSPNITHVKSTRVTTPNEVLSTQNTPEIYSNGGSDMDIDSDIEKQVKESECLDTRKKLRPTSNNSPLIGPPQKIARKTHQPINIRLPDIPIRTPSTLPDTICFDSPSIDWTHLPKSSNEIHSHSHTPRVDNIENATFSPLSSPTTNQNIFQIPTLVKNVGMENTHLSTVTNNVSGAKVIDSSKEGTNDLIGKSALLPTPVQIAIKPQKRDEEPLGCFKLVSLKRRCVRTPLPFKNLEKIPGVCLYSIFRG